MAAPTRNDPPDDLAAAKKAATSALALVAERDKRIAELERGAAALTAPSESVEASPYVVTAVGVSYMFNGDPACMVLGLCRQVVYLVDGEAARLLTLGCVQAATEEDILAEEERAATAAAIAAVEANGPALNPYGGTIVGGVTLESHAAEIAAQIAAAKGNAR